MEALALVVTLVVTLAVSMLLLEEEMLGVVDQEEMTGALLQQRQPMGKPAIAAGRIV